MHPVEQFLLLGLIVIVGWFIAVMIAATSDDRRPWFWQRFRAWLRYRRKVVYMKMPPVNVEDCMGIPTREAPKARV